MLKYKHTFPSFSQTRNGKKYDTVTLKEVIETIV